MGSNPEHEQSAKMSDINKQIVEMKKKIQLSEGQRKALFEECEAERKANADEILRLKKEISQMKISLHENRSELAKYRVQTSRLEAAIGPLGRKTCSEVKESLDLQIIDKAKQLNLLRYKIKQKQQRLSKLGEEYQALVSEKAKRQMKTKIEKPAKKTFCELQNNIHAVEVQWREAVHVRNRYIDIKKSLQDDASRFESNIGRALEQLKLQQNDIEELQKITEEATKMRTQAKSALVQEERAALTSANTRNEQSEEGRRLLEERRQELENLEKSIFQAGKITVRQEPENIEEAPAANDSPPESPRNPEEELIEAFEILKKATGSTSIDEVLERFRSQKSTFERLMSLRKSSEKEKSNLEAQKNNLIAELERYKFAQDKDAEQNVDDVVRIEKEIQEQIEHRSNNVKRIEEINEIIENIVDVLNRFLNSINPDLKPRASPIDAVKSIIASLDEIDVEALQKQPQLEKGEHETMHDDKWLPTPYNSLLRRTPIPQGGATPVPPATTGSEDEEVEVPSRGFLKRQAQLVVDAKSRRKNLRIQLPRKK